MIGLKVEGCNFGFFTSWKRFPLLFSSLNSFSSSHTLLTTHFPLIVKLMAWDITWKKTTTLRRSVEPADKSRLKRGRFSRGRKRSSRRHSARDLSHMYPPIHTRRERGRGGGENCERKGRAGWSEQGGNRPSVFFLFLSLRPYPVREKFRAPFLPPSCRRAPLFARSERESFPRQLLSFSFRRGIKQGATCVRTKCEVKDERIHLSCVN